VPLGGWQPMSMASIGILAGASLLLLVGYQCIVLAMRNGEIAIVAPFRYTSSASGRSASASCSFPKNRMSGWSRVWRSSSSSGLYTFARENKRRAALAQQSEPGSPK
jgi:hypothetical protein